MSTQDSEFASALAAAHSMQARGSRPSLRSAILLLLLLATAPCHHDGQECCAAQRLVRLTNTSASARPRRGHSDSLRQFLRPLARRKVATRVPPAGREIIMNASGCARRRPKRSRAARGSALEGGGVRHHAVPLPTRQSSRPHRLSSRLVAMRASRRSACCVQFRLRACPRGRSRWPMRSYSCSPSQVATRVLERVQPPRCAPRTVAL